MKIVIEVDGDFMGGYLVYNKWIDREFAIATMPVPRSSMEEVEEEDDGMD